MRFARTALGLLLTVAGLVATLAGAVAAFWLVGPDNTITTSSRQLSSKGLAVITAPGLLDRHRPVLHVTATGDRPVFVGVGQDLDVSNYLAGAEHTRLTRFDPPSTFATQEMRGDAARLTPPGELDWWVAQSGGEGKQSIAWPTQDGRYDVVVMNVDGSPAVGAQVQFGVEVDRLFGISLLVFGGGIVLLALGLMLLFRRRRAVAVAPLTPVAAYRPLAAYRPAAFRPASPKVPAARVLTAPAPMTDVEVDPAPAAEVIPLPVASVASPPVAAPESAAVDSQPAAPVDSEPVADVDSPRLARPIGNAPMLMAPADVARAKSPAFLIAVGAVAPDDDDLEYADDHAPYAEEEYHEATQAAESTLIEAPQAAEPTSAESPREDEPAMNETSQDESATDEVRSVDEEPTVEQELVAASLAGSSDEAVRKTAALLASGALLLTTTSCALLPAKNNAATLDTRPAVTLADARAVVQRYNQLNNQANQARDAKLAATIEAEPTLAQTRAGYQISRKVDAAGKDATKPFSFTEPQIGAPEFGSYPMRFVVSSGVSSDPDSHQIGVWQRQSAGAPWLLTNSVYPLKTVKLPPMEGLRTPTQADLDELSSLPDSAGADLATYLSGGEISPKAKLFAPSPGTTKLLQQRATSTMADTKETYIASVDDTFELSGEPLVFITSSGEALVFLAITEQYLQRVEPGSNAYWTSGEATAFSNRVKYTQTIHQDYLHQVALVIPTKATGSPIRILSIDGQLVGAGGT